MARTELRLVTTQAVSSNLPRYEMPIVGREREIAEISAVLRRAHVVTITGPGGIGKTRLAVELAAALQWQEPDGTWFVDLANVQPELMVGAVAGAIGVELVSSQDPTDGLVAALRTLRMLVVLDNCEHVAAGVAELVEAITQSCQRVRVLTTSRKPLGVRAETLYRLSTLDDRSSVELFVAHARNADAHFTLNARNAAAVRDVCKRLDGIAAAIALAAACVRVMPLGQLRARLEGRFRLLLGGNGNVLHRHQTMQALIDWSYDLLTESQQAVFRRLGIFGGSFSREAAMAVAGQDELPALLDASIVEKDGDERFRLLEAIRQYALQRVQDAGESGEVRRRHAEFFATRSAQLAESFGKGSEDAWLSAYLPDLDNFRGALDWARDGDATLAMRIAANLADFWEYANLAGEGLRRSEVILASLRHPNDLSALELLLGIGRLALAMRVYRRSLEVGQRAYAIAERAADPEHLAEARRIAGRSSYLMGIEPEQSLRDLQLALQYVREHGEPFALARTLRDYASALAQREPEEGRRLLSEALSLARKLQWPRLTTHIEINVAEREFRNGEVEAAIRRVAETIAMLRRRRARVQLEHALSNYSAYLSVAGRYEEMFASAREALALARNYDQPIAFTLQSVAVMLADRGEPVKAARILGYVDAFYSRYGMKRELTEAAVQQRLLDILRGALDDESIERESVAGRGLSDDAACALAFGS